MVAAVDAKLVDWSMKFRKDSLTYVNVMFLLLKKLQRMRS